ncbi:organic cation transporter protein-like [Littorina saxatilis]|uniref:Major facilitator superfamily (MFS) profile domain-containing protein n=1 Tax=Littorina saxatilis TaxID=31220 RepID=A0AAN9AJV7_9CAEN
MAAPKFEKLNIKGVDDLITHLGDPGRFQILTFVLLTFNYFPVVFHHVAMAFYGYTPPYECRPRGLPQTDATSINASSIMTSYQVSGFNATETGDEHVNLQHCDAMVMSGGNVNRTLTCDPEEIRYHLPENEQTIVMEWGLVCDRAYWAHLATTVYYCGVMLGGFACGYLSDRLGRRPVVLATLFGATIVGTGLAFVREFSAFIALRFVLGFLTQGMHTASYIMAVELFPTKQRTLAACVIQMYWGAAVLVLGGLSWILRDWRLIQLAISLPSLLAIPYFWLLPESLRWLLAKNKRKEAELLIKRTAVFNKMQTVLREFPERATDALLQQEPQQNTTQQNTNAGTEPNATNALLSSNDDNNNDDKEKSLEHLEKQTKDKKRRQGGIKDLFSSTLMLKRSMILFYIWFAGNLSYFGLTFMSTALGGNRFLNYTLSGCVEFVAYASNIFIVKRFGRRNPLCVYFCLAAVSCLGVGLIPPRTASGDDLTKLITAFGVMGKFAAGGSFSVFELLTVEMYPTLLRNIGAGMCGFWGRLGAVLAPQFLSLGLYTFPQLPAILIGSLTLLGGGLTLLLPDTSHAYLPDTVYEMTIDADGNKSVQDKRNGDQYISTPLLTVTELVSCV